MLPPTLGSAFPPVGGGSADEGSRGCFLVYSEEFSTFASHLEDQVLEDCLMV